MHIVKKAAGRKKRQFGKTFDKIRLLSVASPRARGDNAARRSGFVGRNLRVLRLHFEWHYSSSQRAKAQARQAQSEAEKASSDGDQGKEITFNRQKAVGPARKGISWSAANTGRVAAWQPFRALIERHGTCSKVDAY
jgi:hypothetical protein